MYTGEHGRTIGADGKLKAVKRHKRLSHNNLRHTHSERSRDITLSVQYYNEKTT